MINAPHLRLVDAFSPDTYPFAIFSNIENPHNPGERNVAMERLHQAAHIAGIDDYKLFDEGPRLSFNLRTERDYSKAQVAMQPGKMALIARYYEGSVPHELVQTRCEKAIKILEEILPGKILIMHEPEERAVALKGQDKASYFIAEKLNLLPYLLGERNSITDTPSTAAHNSLPTRGRSPDRPV